MLTQCPSCQTTFRVTLDILRIADGQVRCGRCQTQFDALERLTNESDVADAQSGRYLQLPEEAPTESSARIEVEEPAAREDIILEGRHIEISGRYRMPDLGQGEQVREEIIEEWAELEELDAAPTHQADAAAQSTQIDAQDEELAADAPAESRPSADAGTDLREIDAEKVGQEQPRAAAYAVLTRMAASRSHRAQASADEEFQLLSPDAPHTAAAPIWKILVAPFALLLAIQALHHYRHALARHPQLGAPLMSAYGTLGMTLRPEWDLHAYEILQWHVGSDPALPGTLKVRASIKNMADFAQPYPLLRLVLEDRWGEQVRGREFEPAEYLDPAAAPDRLLAPAQQATATLAIVDPGPDAEGFRFDVCLPGLNGPVCAGEVPQ